VALLGAGVVGYRALDSGSSSEATVPGTISTTGSRSTLPDALIATTTTSDPRLSALEKRVDDLDIVLTGLLHTVASSSEIKDIAALQTEVADLQAQVDRLRRCLQLRGPNDSFIGC